MTTLLEVQSITKKFGGLIAVKNFSTRLVEGELCALIGPNGSGKTTIFNVITGIYAPTEGKVLFTDEDISNKRPDLITERGIARTFQNIRLFKGLNVLENVIVGKHLRLKANPVSAILHLPNYLNEEKEMRKTGMTLLESLDLDRFALEEPTSLPYGLQRKLEIARALATEPRLLLLDEPAAGMNPSDAEELMVFIQHILKSFNLTIFIIEHQMRVVMGICPRIIVIDHGEKIAEGNPDQIQNDERVIEAYLGVTDNA